MSLSPINDRVENPHYARNDELLRLTARNITDCEHVGVRRIYTDRLALALLGRVPERVVVLVGITLLFGLRFCTTLSGFLSLDAAAAS